MPSEGAMSTSAAAPAADALVARVQQHFADSIQALRDAVGPLAAPIAAAAARMAEALRAERKILACGNGGSAADAQHFSAELLNRFERERPPLACIALTTDTSTLTSIGNDYHFDEIFAKQVHALARPGDVLLGSSTSGNPPDVLRAVPAARGRGPARLRLPCRHCAN